MRSAFLVLGPESSGTRLATSILIAGGCYGSADHHQPFDHSPFGDLNPVVWRRSVPHAGEWLDLDSLMRKCTGRTVHAVITTRDWHSTVQSQIAAPHAQDAEESRRKIQQAYKGIFGELSRVRIPFTVLSYESLLLNPIGTQQWLWDELGLQGGDPVVIRDENAKYWRQTRCR